MKVYSSATIEDIQDYIHGLKSSNHLARRNKQDHWKPKVLLSSFHLNGHTLGFHPQTQNLEPPCIAQ